MALIAALAAGLTVREAAGRAHIGERTARRRLEDPAFRRRVADARAALLERAIGRMAASTTAAADTLQALLDAESESVRHAAAKTLLELASRGIELLDLAGRVEQLERAAEAMSPKGRPR